MWEIIKGGLQPWKCQYRVTGSVPNGNRSVTSSVTSTHKNVNFGGTAGKEVVIFFNQTLQAS
jgi:hypothetical protein